MLASEFLRFAAQAGIAGSFIVFGASLAAFLFLYFGFALGGLLLTRWVLPRLRIGAVVDSRPLRDGQIAREIRRSLVSIVIFAGYSVVLFECWRGRVFQIESSVSWARAGVELAVLILWNEVHFYGIHRFLHTRWLYGRVHRIHHESVVPTPFSTYSFHWVEATLLGSVPILPVLSWTFSLTALAGLPVASIFFNTIGHWNYNIYGKGSRIYSASVEHGLHHRRVSGNYGFYVRFPDRWAGTTLSKGAE